MLVHDDVATGEGAAPAYLVDLQGQVLEADGVVAADRTLELEREDQVEVTARAGGEGGAALRRRHLEAAVEFGHVVLAQKAVGFRKGADPVQPEFLRQPSLPGSEVAFRAAPRLGRVSRDHLHAQVAQRTAHLGQTMRVHLVASLRCQPEMTASIRDRKSTRLNSSHEWI